MRVDRRHPPVVGETREAEPRCQFCGADFIDPIHWPPVGVREFILQALGLLR